MNRTGWRSCCAQYAGSRAPRHRVIQFACEAGDPSARWRRARNRAHELGEVLDDRLHHRPNGTHARWGVAGTHTGAPRAAFQLLHRVAIAGHDSRRWAIHAASDGLRGPQVASRSLRRMLAPRASTPDGSSCIRRARRASRRSASFACEDTGQARGDILPDAVADHRRRLDAPGPP